MKKIIDGKAYNTETATLLATVQLRAQKVDNRGAILWDPDSKLVGGQTSLYQTRAGAYFIVRDTKAGMYAEPDFTGSMFQPVTSGLFPLTRKEAMAWAESKSFDVDKIESLFGKVEEVGEKAGAMLLRLPQGLKASVDQAAALAGQSANAWMTRCAERSVNTDMDEIGKTLGEIVYTTRSYTCCDGEGYSASQLGKMFKYLDEQAENLANLLGFDERKFDNLIDSAAWRRADGRVGPPQWKPYDEDETEASPRDNIVPLK